MEVATCRGYRA